MEPLKLKVESYMLRGRHELVCRTLSDNKNHTSLIVVCPPIQNTESNVEYVQMIGKEYIMDKYHIDDKFVFIAESWQKLS